MSRLLNVFLNCPHCRGVIYYDFAMCWTTCGCRVWTTDEIRAREAN